MAFAEGSTWPLAPIEPAAVAQSRRKRAFDIVVAGFALVVFLPLMLLAAAAIWLETGGPVFFRQARGGLGGRAFQILKFRTLVVADDGPAIRQVTADDVRVTRVGRILRKYSIDELPQLLNVLKGEMSLVGPRPHALAHDAQWSAAVPAYRERFRARPGLTGYAQVQGCRGVVRDLGAVRARVEADRDYVEGWSFSLDLKIILQTVPLVFNDPAAV